MQWMMNRHVEGVGMSFLSKKQMSEEDIKLNYITPAIQHGWQGHITMVTKITDGRININGNIVSAASQGLRIIYYT